MLLIVTNHSALTKIQIKDIQTYIGGSFFKNHLFLDIARRNRCLEVNCQIMVKKNNTIKMAERESKLKSILKSISWRLIATSTTFILAYSIFSGSGCEGALEKSTLVAALEMSFKIVIYYFHERLWLRVPSDLSFKGNKVTRV